MNQDGRTPQRKWGRTSAIEWKTTQSETHSAHGL